MAKRPVRRKERPLWQSRGKTPASGPTANTGRASAISTPLAAAGAHGRPFASTVATHSSTVISKTLSPVSDTAWPIHSRRQLRLAANAKTGLNAAPPAGRARPADLV